VLTDRDLFGPLVLGGTILFILLGGPRRYYCSDTACGKRILPGSEVCPGCGVRISRWIKSKKKIYDNEEPEFEE